jgi:TonB family protein
VRERQEVQEVLRRVSVRSVAAGAFQQEPRPPHFWSNRFSGEHRVFIPRNKMKAFLVNISLLFIACLLLQGTGRSAHAQQQQAALSPDDKARGIALYQQHDARGAIKALRSAVKKDKSDADAWYVLGLALNSNNQVKDARKAFETALKLRPKFANAYTALAYILLLNDKVNDAMRDASVALDLDPANAEAHYILGIVALRRGDDRKAFEESAATLKLKASFTPALLLKSQALSNLYFAHSDSTSQQSPEARLAQIKGSVESLEQYLKLTPNAADAATWREQLVELRFYADLADKAKPENDRAALGPSEVGTKAQIFARPEPHYTEDARNHQVSGTVVLRAVLADDGLVKHVLVVHPLSNGLTEAAVRAARQIKFIPAQKNGHPVSQYVQIEYNFNLY